MFEFKFNKEVNNQRENRTKDIVKRLGVITARRVYLKKYPIENPITIFNPAMLIKEDTLILFGRIILGYFTYASAVAEFKVPMGDIYNDVESERYIAEIKVLPDNKFDFWGVEDPRVYEIDGKTLMTYCGRTVNYFNPSIRVERTLPVTAIEEEGKWRKIFVFRLQEQFRGFLVSDKDAFLAKIGKKIKLFHRPHMKDERFYLVTSDVPQDLLGYKKFSEINVNNTNVVLEPSKFEEKIGWGTPPIEIGKEYLFILHGVCAETKCYRIFALLMNRETEVTAITPYYIMEPKENYEIYGDRPYAIFPCGAQLLGDKLLISYGAADSAIGIGEIKLDELMSILDSNRVE